MSSLLSNMCPKCDYYMPLVTIEEATTDQAGNEVVNKAMRRACRACGHQQDEKPGLVMETYVLEQASESFVLQVNEHTKLDPRLPHLHTLLCPNLECASRQPNGKSDVIYKRYDAANMKFLYICNVCDTQWKSGS